ncbi:ABC-type oligopeptide transport system, periplasmic component [Mycoplasmopsis citelli]|uniref:ABC-type oligopeptide transport system, periplasmic component n=1 Tax=Mycoplasmopsis citelli TaxID=171281 RepID=A0A449B2S8_9BACT|nr:ABC transporter substrate-binding protein [Mycoplasmopsis citelli]VEU74892.1 ABC-type oligopeptide transport system, periplasmic component [Mycoplasmopsis citelli]
MKRKLNLKKTLLLTSSLLTGSLTAVAMSCSAAPYDPDNFNSNVKKEYDFGLATDPINNLNYVRYSSLDRVIPSLVESFTKEGPTTSLKSIISIGSFKFALVDTPISVNPNNPKADFDEIFKQNKNKFSEKDGYGGVSGAHLSLDDFEILGGLGKESGNDAIRQSSIYAFKNPKNQNNVSAFTGFLNNGNSVWSNGDTITAQDLRDYFEYILDLNTGSQKLNKILKLTGIRGAEEFVNAQKEYISKFNKPYPNPWGRRKYIFSKDFGKYVQDPNDKVWQYYEKDPQKPGEFLDKEYVDKIHKAALNFGFYTGQLFLDYGNEEIFNNLDLNPDFSYDAPVQDFIIKDVEKGTKTIKLVRNEYVNPYQNFDKGKSAYQTLANDEYSFTMIFDENKTPSRINLIFYILPALFPINRKYIETEVGGIDNYGADVSKFLTSGAFKIASPNDVVFGPQGYMLLTKNRDYYDNANTISNKIKIYFSTDKTTNSTLFEDGYISQTYIPAEKIVSYWSNPAEKQYLNKNQGVGTIAFGFNLDPVTNSESYINDQDLRNYIYYSINRGDLLKTVNWDFSFPVNTWTAFGSHKLDDGRSLEMFFDGQESKAKNGETFELQNYEYLVHLGKTFQLERTNRRDLTYSENTAKFYLERFKKNHPELKGKSITLRYLNNSTEEQRKAGAALQETLLRNSEGFVNIDIKALPENTYASFIETGKYDIIYRNYDYLSGNTVQDYVGVFYKTDEINPLIQKNIGFTNNPVGAWTYQSYISELLLEKLLPSNKNEVKNPNVSKEELLKEIFAIGLQVYSEDQSIKNAIESSSSLSDISNQINKLLSTFKTKILSKTKNILYSALFNNNLFSTTLLEYLAINNSNKVKNLLLSVGISKNNLKNSRLDKLLQIYLYYLLDTNTLDAVNNFKIHVRGKDKTKDLTLQSSSLPLDPITGKSYNLTLADKLALTTFDTAERLEALIVPFSDYEERIQYFKQVINRLSNLTDEQKQAYYNQLEQQTEIEDMKDIFIDALEKNNDQNETVGYLFDFQLKELKLWSKFNDLSMRHFDQKENNQNTGVSENDIDYSGRLDAFFSGNFTDEESYRGWNSTLDVFIFVALLEKVIRDGSPIIPLMEVDTNWEITKIGGVRGVFSFKLQFAYDVTNPPRPGLPRKRDA